MMSIGAMKKGSVCHKCGDDLSGKVGVGLGDNDYCKRCAEIIATTIGLYTASHTKQI